MATGTMTPGKRSPLSIALSVWKALMLREALHRLFASRAAWFWLLLEPLFHLAIISFIFAVIRQRKIGGMETIPWIIIGLIGFFVFRRTVGQMAGNRRLGQRQRHLGRRACFVADGHILIPHPSRAVRPNHGIGKVANSRFL